MASFVKKLETLLQTAAGKGVVDDAQSRALLDLAREQEKHHGVLNLAGILGRLGGLVLVVGVILLVGANWDGISDGVKLGGLLALLAGCHGAAFWIRMSGRDLPKTAEALHFIGAGLFLAGIGLVAQIYHLNSRPPNGVLLWLVAIAPLAWLLRSPTVTALGLFALLLWLHLEGEFRGSPVQMPDNFVSHLSLELGLGVLLAAASGFLRDREPEIAGIFRAIGTFLLFGSLYLLGFYRHFSDFDSGGNATLPLLALGTGAVALGLAAPRLVPGQPWLRNRLVAGLGAVVALALVAFFADRGGIPRGPEMSDFDFGWYRHFDVMDWVVSGAAWLIWFVMAFWCVGYGTTTGRRGFVNVGVAAVGLGVMTRFFDLIGGMAETGLLFTFGGLLLLVTGWGVEKWRRRLTARMGEPS